MRKSSLPLFAMILICLMWLLNYIAGTFYLYWTTSWFDMPVHLLAGTALSVIVIWLLKFDKSLNAFVKVFILVVVIGISWEIFEYMIGQTFALEGHALDTVTDLLMDAIGATLGYFLTIERSRESF